MGSQSLIAAKAAGRAAEENDAGKGEEARENIGESTEAIPY